MLTANQQALLKQAQQKLEEADMLLQQALGPTDVCYETHNAIQNIIEDLEEDIVNG